MSWVKIAQQHIYRPSSPDDRFRRGDVFAPAHEPWRRYEVTGVYTLIDQLEVTRNGKYYTFGMRRIASMLRAGTCVLLVDGPEEAYVREEENSRRSSG